MRKIAVTIISGLLVLFVALSFCSCKSIRITELNERLIIEAIGVDNDSNGKYTVTVQALNSVSSAGSNESDSSEKLTKTLVFDGSSVGDALNKISIQTGKTPLFSQARVLLIGNEAAKNDIGKTLDFFLREYTTRTDILIAITEKSAKETLSVSLGEKTIGAEIIENALISGESTGKTVRLPLYKFMNLLLDEKSGAYCPILTVKKEELSDSYRIETAGTALFEGSRIKSTVDADASRGLLFLTDNISSSDIPIRLDGDIFTLRIVSSKTKIKAPKDITSPFSVIIETECDITEFESERLKKLSSEAVEKARRECENLILDEVKSTFSKAFTDNKCDICRLERRMWISLPKAYRELGEGTKSTYDAVFSVQVKIRRTGKETLGEQ